MTTSDNKKKTPRGLFLLAFVAIAILMFVVNYRSTITQTLPGPKGGVEKLSTYAEQLIAISPTKELYTWDWKDLSRRLRTDFANAQKLIAMSHDRLVWVPSAANNILVVSNLKGDKELKRFSLGVNNRCKRLQASPNGKYAVAALAIDGSDKHIQLAVIDPNLTSILPVETKSMEDGLKLNDIGISNDGTLIAAVGGSKTGWLLVVGGNNKRMLWETAVEDCNELNKVIFSPDGQMVYASEPGRYVYIFDISAKKLVKRLEIDKYKTPPNNPQTISCIAVSSDGRLLAAASSPTSKVWIWDTKTGQKVAIIGTGHFSTSSISFSPDSSLLAGADLTDSPIKIWRIPKNP